MQKLICVLISFLILPLFAQVQKGKIAGKIVDSRSLQPLTGVNVGLMGTQQGAATDDEGFFIISNLEPASYNLEISYLGYTSLKKNNVVVNPGRTTIVEYKMVESILESEAIEVSGSYFEKPKEAVVSTRSMNFEEIRRSPGDIQDIQRVVQAFPAVVSGSDQMNEIIIRGGIPGENLFIMDGIEIPNPNHFPVQGAGGGPINMLNSYLVRDLDFYAGAFSAKYGDKASSVMEITNRDGSRERFRGDVSLGMAGVGGLIEGPAGSDASYIFSARKSFLALIISSTGLTAVPQYYSLQGKLTWDINPQNKLFVNVVFGDDAIKIEEGDEGGYGRGAENVKTSNQQYILGATLRTFWGKNLYSNTTLSAVRTDAYVDVYEFPQVITKKTTFYNNSVESEYHLKSDFVWQVNNNIEITFGGAYKSVQNDYNIWATPDTIFLYDVNAPLTSSAIGIFRNYPAYNATRKLVSFKTAFYSQLSYDFLKQFRVTAGLRYDYFDFNTFSSLSPRLGFSWFLTPELTVNLAYGKHYQSPSYIELNANPLNNNLDNKYTTQYVAGLEYLFRDDMRLTLEGFYKTYDDVPVNRSSTTTDPFDNYQGQLVNAGEGEAYGAELFFQKKLTRSFSSIISYSHSRSQAVDVRTGEKYDWDFDYRNVFTFIMGYKFFWREKSWFKEFKKSTVYGFISWLPFIPADEDEVSIKWRYLGGRPFTPPVYHPEWRKWVVEETQKLNIERFPEYHRLDFRIDKRFIFDSWNLVTFFDLINVYGRDNLWNYNYNFNPEIGPEREKVLQFKVFPVGGLSLEF
jgi:outer membrane receptor for ferrienterochelin and colicin